MTNKKYYYAVWRRKLTTATIRLYDKWTGSITVVKPNGKEMTLTEYFGGNTHMAEKATMPLDVLGDGANRKFDAVIEIKWGGLGGQADAIKLAFARALLEWDNSVRATLKPYWLLKRDPRVKERKKFGRLKARKAPHRSKR